MSTVHQLINNVLDDPVEKARFLLNFHGEERSQFIPFPSNDDPVQVQCQKLDLLRSIVNLDDIVRESLGASYVEFVRSIYTDTCVQEVLMTTDLIISLKYIKLINSCLDKCPIVPYLHGSRLREYFEYLVNRIIPSAVINGHTVLQLETPVGETLVELLKFFLLFNDCDGNDSDNTPMFGKALELLALSLADKYSDLIDLRYCVTKKLPLNTPTYDGLNNEGLNLCLPIPQSVQIPSQIETQLISLCLAVYCNIGPLTLDRVGNLWDNIHFDTFVKSLLKNEDLGLKSAALQFLLHPILTRPNGWKDIRTLRQVLPYLYSSFENMTFPWWFDPFEALINLLELYNKNIPASNPVLLSLDGSNLINGFMQLLFDYLPPPKSPSGNASSSKTLTKLIKLCASFAAYNENYSFQLLDDKCVVFHLKRCIVTHVKLINHLLANKQLLFDMHVDLSPLYNSELTLAWLLLLKSFSRSVAALKTTLKRNKIAELSLMLLRGTYDIIKECYPAGKTLLETEMKIMGLALGCTSNFVIEFADIQDYLLDSGIITFAKDLLADPLFNPGVEWTDFQRREAFRDISVTEVKTNILWLLRHLVYNSQDQNKLNLLERIDLSTILSFTNDPSWSVQEQCFQLLRNLSCNSKRVIDILLETFERQAPPLESASAGSSPFFYFLVQKMHALDTSKAAQCKTLEAILYMIVNIAAVDETKKQLVIEQDEILKILCIILEESPVQNARKYGNNNELKLATLWILHNLLWSSGVADFNKFSLVSSFHSSRRNSLQQNNYESLDPKSPLQSPSSPGSESQGTRRLISALGGVTSPKRPKGTDKEKQEGEEEEKDGFLISSMATSLGTAGSSKTIERCRKLMDFGFYDLVRQNLHDYNLNVEQKARSLLDLMDKLKEEQE